MFPKRLFASPAGRTGHFFSPRDGTGEDLALTPLVLLLFISLTWAALFAVNLSSPSDLMDKDQQRPAAYVLDVVRNGNWICQRDVSGAVTSKPPLYTWLAALVTLPFGRISRFTLYLPSALSVLGVSWLLTALGSMYYGRMAGFLAAIMYLLSSTSLRQLCLARTDPLFSLTVFAAAWFAYTAWVEGKGWTRFWLMSAAAVLTKGPLGVLIALGGLWAIVWEKYDRKPFPPLRGSHLTGILLFLCITAGWFLLAYAQMGRALIDRVIRTELVGHALLDGKQRLPPGHALFNPPLYFLARFAPWSIAACFGFWRIVKRPSADHTIRRFERFWFCYFFFGLLIFSVSPHQRPDHLFPLLPAAALIAAPEVSNVLRHYNTKHILYGTAVSVLVSLLFAFIYLHVVRGHSDPVQRTRWTQELARVIRREVGSEFPLIHIDSPYALQFELNTMKPVISPERAAPLLKSDYAAFLVVKATETVEALRRMAAPPLYEVLRRPDTDPPYLRIISNHPRLEYTRRMATFAGPILIRMDGADLQESPNNNLLFRAKQPCGKVILSNVSDSPCPLRARISNTQPEIVKNGILAPGETWELDFGSEISAARDIDCRVTLHEDHSLHNERCRMLE